MKGSLVGRKEVRRPSVRAGSVSVVIWGLCIKRILNVKPGWGTVLEVASKDADEDASWVESSCSSSEVGPSNQQTLFSCFSLTLS